VPWALYRAGVLAVVVYARMMQRMSRRRDSLQAVPEIRVRKRLLVASRELTWRAARSLCSWPTWAEEKEETRSSMEMLIVLAGSVEDRWTR
jgi:hypothetical protein